MSSNSRRPSQGRSSPGSPPALLPVPSKKEDVKGRDERLGSIASKGTDESLMREERIKKINIGAHNEDKERTSKSSPMPRKNSTNPPLSKWSPTPSSSFFKNENSEKNEKFPFLSDFSKSEEPSLFGKNLKSPKKKFESSIYDHLDEIVSSKNDEEKAENADEKSGKWDFLKKKSSLIPDKNWNIGISQITDTFLMFRRHSASPKPYFEEQPQNTEANLKNSPKRHSVSGALPSLFASSTQGGSPTLMAARPREGEEKRGGGSLMLPDKQGNNPNPPFASGGWLRNLGQGGKVEEDLPKPLPEAAKLELFRKSFDVENYDKLEKYGYTSFSSPPPPESPKEEKKEGRASYMTLTASAAAKLDKSNPSSPSPPPEVAEGKRRGRRKSDLPGLGGWRAQTSQDRSDKQRRRNSAVPALESESKKEKVEEATRKQPLPLKLNPIESTKSEVESEKKEEVESPKKSLLSVDFTPASSPPGARRHSHVGVTSPKLQEKSEGEGGEGADEAPPPRRSRRMSDSLMTLQGQIEKTFSGKAGKEEEEEGREEKSFLSILKDVSSEAESVENAELRILKTLELSLNNLKMLIGGEDYTGLKFFLKRCKKELKKEEKDEIFGWEHEKKENFLFYLVEKLPNYLHSQNQTKKSEKSSEISKKPVEVGDFFNLFFDLKLDILAQNRNRDTIAHVAAKKGKFSALKAILKKEKCLLKIKNLQKDTPLLLCCKECDSLIDSPKNLEKNPEKLGKSRLSSCLEVLLSEGADFLEKDISGSSPLHLLARRGDPREVRNFLSLIKRSQLAEVLSAEDEGKRGVLDEAKNYEVGEILAVEFACRLHRVKYRPKNTEDLLKKFETEKCIPHFLLFQALSTSGCDGPCLGRFLPLLGKRGHASDLEKLISLVFEKGASFFPSLFQESGKSNKKSEKIEKFEKNEKAEEVEEKTNLEDANLQPECIENASIFFENLISREDVKNSELIKIFEKIQNFPNFKIFEIYEKTENFNMMQWISDNLRGGNGLMGIPPWYTAVEHGNLEALKFFVENSEKLKINFFEPSRMRFGFTPLHLLASNLGVGEEIFKNQKKNDYLYSPPSSPPSGPSPKNLKNFDAPESPTFCKLCQEPEPFSGGSVGMSDAGLKGVFEIVKKIIILCAKHQQNVNQKLTSDLRTPLHLAALAGNYPVLVGLLERGGGLQGGGQRPEDTAHASYKKYQVLQENTRENPAGVQELGGPSRCEEAPGEEGRLRVDSPPPGLRPGGGGGGGLTAGGGGGGHGG